MPACAHVASFHGSMRGFVVVTDSPWAAKTDSTGVVSFRDVPEGAARLRVWHADQLGGFARDGGTDHAGHRRQRG